MATICSGTGVGRQILEDIVKGSFGKNAGLFNNAGQHYNHLHFWKWMSRVAAATRFGGLKRRSSPTWLPVAEMKEDFIQAGVTQFGSGWAWLASRMARSSSQRPRMANARSCTAPNRSSAATSGSTPTTSHYRNRRPDYLKAFLDHLVIGIRG